MSKLSAYLSKPSSNTGQLAFRIGSNIISVCTPECKLAKDISGKCTSCVIEHFGSLGCVNELYHLIPHENPYVAIGNPDENIKKVIVVKDENSTETRLLIVRHIDTATAGSLYEAVLKLFWRKDDFDKEFKAQQDLKKLFLHGHYLDIVETRKYWGITLKLYGQCWSSDPISSLSFSQQLQMSIQLVKQVQRFAAVEWIHGDLHTGNICRHLSKPTKCYLVDFGLSRPVAQIGGDPEAEETLADIKNYRDDFKDMMNLILLDGIETGKELQVTAKPIRVILENEVEKKNSKYTFKKYDYTPYKDLLVALETVDISLEQTDIKKEL